MSNIQKKDKKKISFSPLAKLKTYFLTGLLVTMPISITALLVWKVIEFFDAKVTPLLPEAYNPESYSYSIPGVGLLVFVAAIILIGFLTANFLGKSVVRLGEWFVGKMPIIRSLYSTMKQIFETVLSQKSESFRQVVLVEYPRRGLWALGLVSGQAQGEIQHKTQSDLVSVFVPTTPNPTSGFLLFVPKSELHILDMSVEDGLKMVVSSGIITPPYQKDPALKDAIQETSVPN